MKKLLFTFLAAVLFLPNLALAATFEHGEEVYINEKVLDDLYASGGMLNVQSDVNGDLLAAGGRVDIKSLVSQDLMAAGGDVFVTGEVGDDVRVAGGTVRIDAMVKGDLMAAGGDVTLSESSFVGGDASIGGGNVVIGGDVYGDLKLAGGSIYLNSDIKGDVALYGFEKVTFGPNAKIRGDLWYRAYESLEVPEGMVQGQVVLQPIPANQIEESLPAALAGFSLYSLLATLFFGLFFLWLCKFYILHAAENAYDNTLKAVGVGFLVLVLTPIAALVFLVTTIGLPLALTTLALWFIFLYMGKVMASMLIGYKIVKVNGKSSFGRLFGGFALGALIYTLIGMVPVVGWIVNLVFIMIALGSMALYELDVFQELRKKKIV